MSHPVEVEIVIPFCEGDLHVWVRGTFFPRVPAYTPAGEYAPVDPPEPAMIEDMTVVCYDPRTEHEIDITTLIPEGSWDYLMDRAVEAIERGDF